MLARVGSLTLTGCIALLACNGATPSGPAAETSASSSSGGGTTSSGAPGKPAASSSSSGGSATPGEKLTPASWGPTHCPAPGANVGFDIGDSFGDLGLKDCDTGADADMKSVCGASAVWVFAAHSHCPTCQATSSFMNEIAPQLAEKNVAIVLSVYNDNGTTCAKWREVYKLAGLANVKVFADPESLVWDKVRSQNVTAASAFLDKSFVVSAKQHSLGKDDVLKQIDAALAK